MPFSKSLDQARRYLAYIYVSVNTAMTLMAPEKTEGVTYQPPFARSSMPSCARARTTPQSDANACSPCCSAKSTLAVHCASACRAIHSCRLANSRRGIALEFCAGHKSGCVRADRDRQSRLQNLAGQEGTFEVPGQETVRLELFNGVVQYVHTAEAVWRSYRDLEACGDSY